MAGPPLVSCLCVTRERVPLLRRAVACYLDQTHVPRELVVVHDSDDDATRAFLAGLSEPTVRGVEVASDRRLTLGMLRNVAVRAARGAYVAQWDDDDWHAPTRLEDQMEVIARTGRPACVLLRWTVFDAETQAAYISGERPWEGSLVAERGFISPYTDDARGEDTAVIRSLAKQDALAYLDDPHLYIYVYHGRNVWDREHWRRIMEAAKPLSPAMSARVAAVLAGAARGSAAAETATNGR